MSELLIPTLLILLLIVLNGFFVAAEFSLIGSPRTLLEKELDEGSVLARKVLSIIDDPKRQDRYIATAQLGITLASLGLGMYGEHTLAEWLTGYFNGLGWNEESWIAAHSSASILAVGFLTYFHIVLGEMIPKSLALQNPQRVAKWIAPAMSVFQWAVLPLVATLNGAGGMLLRLVGIRRENRAEHYHTPEELSYIVDESETGGELGKESASVLRELLEFGDLTAGEVMVPRTAIVGLPMGSTSEEIQELLLRRPHTRYLVYENDLDRVVGFIHVKDLLRFAHNPNGFPAEAVRPLPFVPASSHLETVLKAMRKSHSQLTVVMDEHGGTAGLITVEDLFEEVVGEISEDSSAQSEIYQDPMGHLHALGTVRLAELGERLERELEHDSVDTVSGLVLASLERPAQVSDRVTFGGIEFEVISIKGRGVKECIVRVLPEPPSDDSDE